MKFLKVLLVTALWSQQVIAANFTVSTGADYSSGKYGSSDSTNVGYVPFSLSYGSGDFTYKVTIPYITVEGAGDIIPSGLGGSGSGSSAATGSNGCTSNSGKGNVRDRPECSASATTSGAAAVAGTTRARTTESGLGDISALVTYNLLNNRDSGWIVDLTGKVKFPTASESRGLGSGQFDYAFQANVDKYFGAKYIAMGLGYRVLGEPTGVQYNNVTYGSLGGGYLFSKATKVGFSYDTATAAVDGRTQPQEISIYGSHRFNDEYRLNAVIYKGLSDASPDLGGGATLFYFF